MARGTFANIRLVNKFMDKQGPQTIHFPSGEVVSTHASLNCGSLTTEWISAGFPSNQLRFLLQSLIVGAGADSGKQSHVPMQCGAFRYSSGECNHCKSTSGRCSFVSEDQE